MASRKFPTSPLMSSNLQFDGVRRHSSEWFDNITVTFVSSWKPQVKKPSYFPAQKSISKKIEGRRYWLGMELGYCSRARPMLMRLSPITPSPTHRFIPALPL